MMPSSLRPKQRLGEENVQKRPIEPSQRIGDQNDISNPTQQSNFQNNVEEINRPSSLRPKNTKFPFEEENDLERNIERNVAQGTSRIGEAVLGAPGDILSMIKGFVGDIPVGGVIGEFLPTSGELKEISEKTSLGYTKPKSELEEKSGEVLQDIASFAMPGAGQYSFLRNIGIPVVSNLAKQGIKSIGKEEQGDAAKIGLMIGLDLISHRQGGAKKFAGNLFNQSEKIVPEGAKLSSPTFEKSLSKLEKTLSSGGTSPSTEKALKKVNEIKSKIDNGKIEVKELIDFRKKINEIIAETGGFEVQLPKAIKKKAIANLHDVKKEVINGLNEYGKKSNPEFLKLNKAANEAYGAYESSNKMAKFIKDTSSKFMHHTGMKALFGLGGGYGVLTHPIGAAKTAGATIPLIAGYEGYKILHQVLKSPTLRKYYGNILKGAASGNTAQVTRNVKALDQSLGQESK
jgi:ElaB/YqjD/DUF883 family membrane-anchored ribosome-binding protein